MRKGEYKLNPKNCLTCGVSIIFEKRRNNFCCSSCSTTFNNIKRGCRSEETKRKIGSKRQLQKSSNETKEKIAKTQHENGLKRYSSNKTICLFCEKELSYEKRKRKTCNKECATSHLIKSRKYLNGRQKSFWYENKTQGKVFLESSWELRVAQLLDKKEIEWLRPSPMKWIDKANITHLYYADFYLPKLNIYLDPKNLFCMSKDKEKMEQVEKKVNIIYGDIKIIENYINNIC
jgi:hypothetical protein